MRRIVRFAIGALLVVGLSAVVLYLARKPIVEAAIERTMAGMGFVRPDASVEAVSLSGMTLTRLTAGADRSRPDLSLGRTVAEYDFATLVFRRKAASIAIDDGAIVVRMPKGASLSVAGWSPDPNAPRVPPPVAKTTIKRLQTIWATPAGAAGLTIAGDFDYTKGGAFNLALAAKKAGAPALSIADAAGKGVLTLAADGRTTLSSAVRGDIATPAGLARGVDGSLSADLRSWRGIFGEGSPKLQGEATLAVKSSTIDASAAPALASLMARGQTPIKTLSADGVLTAKFADSGVVVTLPKGPLTIAADRGDRLAVSGADRPLYERRDGVARLALKAALEGPVASGAARVDAASKNGGPWSIRSSLDLGEQTIGDVSLVKFAGSFAGAVADGRLKGDVDLDAHVRSAGVGTLRISDMPARGRFAIAVDRQSLTATPVEPTCLDVARAGFRIGVRDTDANVAGARLCPAATPLVTVKWGERATTHIEGALAARSARYRVGNTVLDGAPPRIDFVLDYEPGVRTSRIVGDIAGGRVLLNDGFILSEAKGDFAVDIVGDAMSAKAALAAMKIAQNADPVMVAPVAVAGGAALVGDIARFDFKVATPNGRSLGRGEGIHHVKTGTGQALFDSGLLKFGLGLQPDIVLPALRGVVSNASGAGEGRAVFDWAPERLSSSATLNLDNVSFAGPGVAVTRTEGVTGKLVFTNLAPATTAGEQTLSIRKIDLDALDLDNGAMRFELPGDQTLKINEAEFPWFGGTIGVYGSTMKIGGGESETTLQIDNVDLARLLAYVNIDGLSGTGTIEGVLPIAFSGGKARVKNGVLSSKEPGVIRYEGKAAAAASQSTESSIAFEVLRELRFNKLAATIDGPLDGTLNFKILFEGRGDLPVRTGKKTQRVDSPVIYRLTINAPLLSLIEQAILSTDVKMQIERAKKEQEGRESEAQ